MKKEAKYIGILMPSHPDFLPIIQKLRKKYNLKEFNSEDSEPVEELFAAPPKLNLILHSSNTRE